MENQDGATQKKGTSRGVKIFAWILGIGILLSILAASGNSGGSSTSPTTASDTPSDPIAVACQASSSPQTISYKQLEKDPTSFQGQDTTFTGQVLQIQESNGAGYMRLAVDKDAYGNWNFSDVVLVQYEGTTAAVQDDVVTVNGILEGSQTYTSQANFQITVPLLYGCSIQKGTKSSFSTSAKTSTIKTTSVPAQTQTSTPTQPTYTTPNGAVINSQDSVVTPAPAAPVSWHTAYTYSNSTSIHTPSFALQGQQQKITYTCSIVDSTNPYGGNFNGIIQATVGYDSDVFAAIVTCPTNTGTYEYSLSPGQYYLNLDGTNSSYTVTVEDYY